MLNSPHERLLSFGSRQRLQIDMPTFRQDDVWATAMEKVIAQAVRMVPVKSSGEILDYIAGQYRNYQVNRLREKRSDTRHCKIYYPKGGSSRVVEHYGQKRGPDEEQVTYILSSRYVLYYARAMALAGIDLQKLYPDPKFLRDMPQDALKRITYLQKYYERLTRRGINFDGIDKTSPMTEVYEFTYHRENKPPLPLTSIVIYDPAEIPARKQGVIRQLMRAWQGGDFWHRAAWYHTAPEYIPEILEEVDRIYHQTVQSYVKPAGKDGKPVDKSTAISNIATMHWLLVHAMPYTAGSAGIADMFARTMFDSLGLKTSAWKKDLAPDLEALVRPLDNFIAHYESFFMHPIVREYKAG